MSDRPPAVIGKKTLWQRFKGAIFVAGPKDVKEALIEDVLKPSIRDFLADSLYSIVDVAIYGKGGTRGRGRRRGSGAARSVIDFTDPDRARDDRTIDNRRRGDEFDFSNIYFPDRHVADDVFNMMMEKLEEKGEVMVYYFYELAQLTPPHTLQNWGWKSLEGTGYNRGPDGVALVLPKPVLLKR